MKSIIFALAIAAIFAMPAKADETVKWRHVQHAALDQFEKVGDVNGHNVGIYRLQGLALFSDGSTGTTLVVGTQDFTLGMGGTVDGYYSVKFGDGSELWMKFTGTVKPGGTGKVLQKGAAIVTGGKGRYAGAKGDGSWEGEETLSITTSYIDNVINIKK
jgi:hypothetical protein